MAYTMLPCKWSTWVTISLAIASAAVGMTIKLNQQFLRDNLTPDYSELLQVHPVRGRLVTVNLTDAVYKSALRFLRCCAEPGNPHGIALLDPLIFSWDQLAQRQTIRLSGTISGNESYISQLKINYVSVAVFSASARFLGVIPQLSISGTYNITGTLAKALPLFGSGPYSITMANVSLEVATELGINKNGSVYMSNFTVDFFPESIQVSFGELLGGGPLGAMIQDFLQDSAPQVLGRGRPLIQEDIRKTVVAAATRSLATLPSFNDLVKFLVTFGNVTEGC